MIRGLVALSVKFRVLVVGAALVVLAAGVGQLRSASVDALPEFAPTQVEIQAEALGLSAAEVEQLITVPIEQDLLNGVQWLDQMRSQSAPGLSLIDLTFQPGTDLLKARQAVQERLTQAHALPAVGTPPVMVQPLSSTSRVMMVGLSSPNLSLVDLSVLARWKIRPRLMGIPGVANVSIWGQRDRQLQVQVDSNRLREYGVTLNQVITSAGNALWVSALTFVEASTPGTGGFIETSTQRLAIQHVIPITAAKDLSAIPIEDTTTRVGDVASVVEDHQPLIGDAILSGKPGLILVVQKFPDASTQNVTDDIQKALDDMRPGLSGVQINTNIYQAQSFVDTALHTTWTWGLISLVLLCVVLALVLFSWRMTLIVVVSVLLSLVAAAYVLYLRGTPFNLMTLAGLTMVLVVVIDDPVVDVGAIRQRLRECRDAGDAVSVPDVVTEVTTSVRRPLMFALVAVLLVPLPLALLDGVQGSFSVPAVVAYALAVLASTVVALTVTPALAALLLPDGRRGRLRSPVEGWTSRLLGPVLERYLSRPRWAFATVAVLAVTALSLVPYLHDWSQLPTPQDRNVLVQWQAAPGTSLTEMARITTRASQELRTIPGIQDVGAHLGRAVLSDQDVNVDSGELWINIAGSADYDATVSAIEGVLDGYPGMRSQLETYTQDRIQAAQPAISDSLVVRVYGADLAVLDTKAQELRRLVAAVPGVVEPQVQTRAEEPTLQVQVNLAAAQRYGLSPGDVRRVASTYFSGLLVGNLYQDQEIFDVVVWGASNQRASVTDLANVSIDTPTGDQVHLGDVASVTVTPYPAAILHDGTSRYVDVTAQVSGRSVDSVLADVRGRVASVGMPLEYHAEVLSNSGAQQDQFRRTLGLSIGIALAVFLLLQAAFNSWRPAALVFMTLPLAAVGGLVGAFLAGGTVSLGGALGLLAVLALATRNAVLLIRAIQRHDASDAAADRATLVLRATRERAGPVLLSAVATALVLLPILLLGSTAGTEVLHPLVAVLLGGLVTTALFTLLVLPALYLHLSPATSEFIRARRRSVRFPWAGSRSPKTSQEEG